MGPPKQRKKRLPYSEIKRQHNTFEYRWDGTKGAYYMFNPYTGETIISSQDEILNRNLSLWGKIERYPSKEAQTTELLPEFYLSRRWGRRRFSGWRNIEEAAIHMTAVARGFLARLHLRKYFEYRYIKRFDTSTGYYYFLDNFNDDTTTNSSWYKPTLAFPDDVKEFIEINPDDYLKGKKFSKQDYMKGPFLTVNGLSKYDVGRKDLDEFLIPNYIRSNIALRTYDQIDLTVANFKDVIAWFDGENIRELTINEFHLMRTAIVNNDWSRVLYIMKNDSENMLLQMYGFHNFAKSDVPMDISGVIDFATHEAMEMCLHVIKSEDFEKYCQLIRIFAMRAFHNIICVRPARTEYLSVGQVMEQGEGRHAAVEAYLKSRLNIFNKYLQNIPNETILTFEKGAQTGQSITRPLTRSVQIVEEALKCLSILAHEQEAKEPLAYLVIEPTLFALDICQDEAMVVEYGLKLLYNLCYRCESAHEALLICCRPQSFFATIHHHHSGDPGVMRHCRKLELTMASEGWRGNVEEIITQEMKAAEIKSIEHYLDEKMSNLHVNDTVGVFGDEAKASLDESALLSRPESKGDYLHDYGNDIKGGVNNMEGESK